MPAPVCAAPPSWGRHPKTFTISDLRSKRSPDEQERYPGLNSFLIPAYRYAYAGYSLDVVSTPIQSCLNRYDAIY
jgi:hypothetical protein